MGSVCCLHGFFGWCVVWFALGLEMRVSALCFLALACVRRCLGSIPCGSVLCKCGEPHALRGWVSCPYVPGGPRSQVASGSSREETADIGNLHGLGTHFSCGSPRGSAASLRALESEIAAGRKETKSHKRKVDPAAAPKPPPAKRRPIVALASDHTPLSVVGLAERVAPPVARVQDPGPPEHVSETMLVRSSRAPANIMDAAFDVKSDRKLKKSKKHKKRRSRKASGSISDSSAERRDRKKRRRRSSSSSESSSMSSVFRGESKDTSGKTWNALRARARVKPGRMASKLLQRMADQVSRDGVASNWKKTDAPPVAQAYFNRVLAAEGVGIPAHQRRDRRESETFCTLLELIAQNRC